MQSKFRILSLALVLLVTACGAPPRDTATDPDAPLPPPPADNAATDEDRDPDTTPYDLESEGTFPPPRDVEFEEDRLPPPETMDATPVLLEDRPVRDETVPAEVETPVEPSIQTPVAPTVQTPVRESQGRETVRGWRVQIAASGERADAERTAREARTRLGLSVYVDQEGTLFKVRAGDFVDRAAADRARERAQSQGYSGAWIVTTEVVPESGSGS